MPYVIPVLSEDEKELRKKKFDKQHQVLFIIGLIMNQSISAELAWKNSGILINRFLKHEIPLDCESLRLISIEQLFQIMCEEGEILHRFPKRMSYYIHNSCRTIAETFDNQVKFIWEHPNGVFRPTNEVLKNFMLLKGMGQHKSMQAIFYLANIYNEMDIDEHSVARFRSTCSGFFDNYLDELDQFLNCSIAKNKQEN
jgi:hypothetical protein